MLGCWCMRGERDTPRHAQKVRVEEGREVGREGEGERKRERGEEDWRGGGEWRTRHEGRQE